MGILSGMTTKQRGVLIVGAGPRLGSAIARALAGTAPAGTGLAGTDRPVGLIAHNPEKLAAVAESLQQEGMKPAFVAADVADPAALTSAITQLSEQVGEFEIAVHNVSRWRSATALELTPQQLFDDLSIGAASLLTMAQAVAPGMTNSGGGTILATGSMAADRPSPEGPSLGVQKAALRVLVKALAAQLAPDGIHCATVTINGGLDDPGFEADNIAQVYRDLVAETSGPRDSWRTVVDFP